MKLAHDIVHDAANILLEEIRLKSVKGLRQVFRE
jgi:hypothetical protein